MPEIGDPHPRGWTCCGAVLVWGLHEDGPGWLCQTETIVDDPPPDYCGETCAWCDRHPYLGHPARPTVGIVGMSNRWRGFNRAARLTRLALVGCARP